MRKPFNVITEEVKLEMYEAYGEVSDRTWADIKTIAQYVPGNMKDVDKSVLCRSMLGGSLFTIWTDTPRFVTMEEFVSDKTDSVPLRGLYCGLNAPISLVGKFTPALAMDASRKRCHNRKTKRRTHPNQSNRTMLHNVYMLNHTT